MKTNSSELLVNATGQLMQQHIFDHLSDEKLAKMNSCLQKLGNHNPAFVADHLEQHLVKRICLMNQLLLSHYINGNR